MQHTHPDTTHRRDTTHRHETTAARALLARLAPVAALPLALWALAYPAAAALTLAALATLYWHRRVARTRARPRPTRPPD